MRTLGSQGGLPWKNGNDVLNGRHRLAQQNSALSVWSITFFGQPNEVLQFDSQDRVTTGNHHVLGHGKGIACDQQQVLVKFAALFLSLRVQDAKGSPLGPASVVGKFSANLIVNDLISRARTRTQSYSNEQSVGWWIFDSTMVQSIRTLRPFSTFKSRDSSKTSRLMSSRVSGCILLMFC